MTGMPAAPTKVLAAMSGGVDSSVTALLLKERFPTVCGATMLLWEKQSAPMREAEDARRVCEQLGLEHHILPMTELFWQQVITPFAEGYRRGETPNPCVFCNRSIKFTGLLEQAAPLGCDAIATGHYARVEYDRGAERFVLRRALDRSKDQSYVLYVLPQALLPRVLFPLGALSKPAVRALAAEAGLPTASKSDSQDICFVEDGDYAAFLEQRMGLTSVPGDFVTAGGEILGRHQGLFHYTLGQRRGLGVSAERRIFVLGKNEAENTILLGDEQGLYARQMWVEEVNWVSIDPPTQSLRAQVKSRYRQEPSPAWLHPQEQGVLVEFDAPQRALTNGQAAVFYDADEAEYLLGGGVIRPKKEAIR